MGTSDLKVDVAKKGLSFEHAQNKEQKKTIFDQIDNWREGRNLLDSTLTSKFFQVFMDPW